MTTATALPPVPPAAPAPEPEFSNAPKRDWFRILTFAAIIVFAGLFVAAPAFHGTWLWDDDQEISANAAVQNVAGIKDIWTPGRVGADYLPVKTTFLWAEWKLFKLMGMQHDATFGTPGGSVDYQGTINIGYHVINALFHILNALLIWYLFHRLKIKWAWLGGLLFAIHPVLVESVAWVTEQKNTLSLIFMLLSFITYMNYHERRKTISLVASCLWFLASVLSKSAVIMVPFCIILYVWWADNKFKWRDLILFVAVILAALGMGPMVGAGLTAIPWNINYLWLFLAGMACAAVFTGLWWVIKGEQSKYVIKLALGLLPFFVIAVAVSAITMHWQFEKAIGAELIPVGGIVSRFATAGMATWFYLLKCIWPFPLPPMEWFSSAFSYGLVPIYERWDVVHPTFMQLVVPWLAMFAVLGLCAYKSYKGKAWSRHVILGLGFFFGNLVPALGFITMSYMRITWVADHFVYISIIGVLGLGIAGAAALYEKIPAKGRPWAVGAGIAALFLLSMHASFYSDRFLNESNMWLYTLSKNPDAWQAHSRYGKVCLDHGRTDEAYFHIQQSNRLRPDLAETNNNMGVLLMNKNRLPEAIPYFRRAVRLMPIGAFLLNYSNALTKASQLTTDPQTRAALATEAAPSYEKLMKMNGGPGLAKYISDSGAAALNTLFSERGGVTLGDIVKTSPTRLNIDLADNKNTALDKLLKNRLGADYDRAMTLQGGEALQALIKLRYNDALNGKLSLSDTLNDMLKLKSAANLEQLVKNKGGKALENELRKRGILDDILSKDGADTLRKVFDMDAGNESFFGLRATRGSDAYEKLVTMMSPDPLEYMYTLGGGDKLKQLLNATGSDRLMKLHDMEGTEAYGILADMMGGDPIQRLQEAISVAAAAGGDPAQRLAEMNINDPSVMLINYGASLAQAGRRDDAIQAYQNAIKIKAIPDAMVNYAIMLTQMNRGPEAVPTFEQLLKAEPYASNPQILANAGIALAQAGRKDDSIRVLQRALQINPNLTDVQRILDQVEKLQPAAPAAPVVPSLPALPVPMMIPGATDPAQMPIPAVFQNK